MTTQELNRYIHPATMVQWAFLLLAAALMICDKVQAAKYALAFSVGVGVGYLLLRFIPFPGVTR